MLYVLAVSQFSSSVKTRWLSSASGVERWTDNFARGYSSSTYMSVKGESYLQPLLIGCSYAPRFLCFCM
jgi:hypothetical protein